MTSTEIANASKIMIGTTEAIKMYIGSTVMWEPQVSARYDAEIKYLEGNGSQYIDLNVIPDENTGIYIQAVDSNQSGSYDHYTTGLRDDSGDTRWCIGYSSNLGWYYGYGSYTTISNNTYPGSIAKSTLNYLNSKTATCTVNGTTSTVNLPTLPFSPQNNIRIFGTSGASANYAKWSGKIYAFKVSQGSTVVMDLIPVRVGQVGYMYDKVTGRLFGNSGTGNFILGGDKLSTGYTELEYISSTSSGGQYIDLNILLYDVLNKQYDIAIKFKAKGSGQDNTTQGTIFGCQDNTGSPWPGTFIRIAGNNVQGRYIGSSGKDNTLGQVGNIIELTEKTSPNKNVYNYNNSGRTHTWGTSLFCIFNNQNKTNRIRYIEADLYYFKLFVEGALVRDLIPCKNNSNVVGMYDVVNDVFYTSPNGVAFVAGPEA